MGLLEEMGTKEYVCRECCSTFSRVQVRKLPEDNMGCVIMVILFLTVIGGIIWLIIEAIKDKTPKFIPCPNCGAQNSYLFIKSPKGQLFIKENNLNIN